MEFDLVLPGDDDSRGGRRVAPESDPPENDPPRRQEPRQQADALDVEIVDDTPPADRGKKPLKDADAHDVAALEDEAEQYSAEVRKRINKLTHKMHDERRAREAIQRERDELQRLAQTNLARVRALEQQLTYGEASYAGEVTDKARLALANAKEKYRKAYEAGDPDAIAEATAEMASAAQQEENAKRWHAQAKQRVESSLQQERDGVDSAANRTNAAPSQPQPAAPDQRAQEWVEDNPWFGSDEAMTALAYGVHERLVRGGVDPVKDAENYYATINKEMRKRFPEYDWGDDQPPADDAPRGGKKTPPPVAPVSRNSAGGKRKVVLTKTQVELAERLGLTLEQYASEVLRMKEAGEL